MMAQNPPFDPYQLTPFDHSFPMFYSGSTLSFRLDRPEDGVPILQAALERLAEYLPFLTGVVSSSCRPRTCETGVKEVQPAPSDLQGGTSIFIVRRFPHLRLPSFLHQGNTSQDRESDKFYARDASYILIPHKMVTTNFVIRFQANVVADGIILASFMNHMVMDGTGIGTIYKVLAACCRSISIKEKISLPTTLDAEAATRARIFQFTSHPGITSTSTSNNDAGDHAPSLTEEESNDLSLIDYNFRFSAKKIQWLKDGCKRYLSENSDSQPSGQELPVISSDDVVTALLWVFLSRFRFHADDKQNMACTLMRTADIRQRMQTPLGNSYLGNAVIFLNETRFLEELSCVGDSTTTAGQALIPLISDLARCLRIKLANINDDYIRQSISQHALSNQQQSSMVLQNFDIAVTSVRNTAIFEEEFGPVLGKVQDFELLPYMAPQGVCSIKPKHPNAETWDIGVTLSRDDMTLLRNDPWFRWMVEDERHLKVFDFV